ncbi:hypothetical protein [Sulfuricurvum sp.]|uniref:hypothetical protein n=1 Tax=Sulfuricurvum sp. TaxID=2025608 RepID=UPI002616A1DA|nr:hypothetical protein [Sulfuricurvum sp.]MDD3594995.1 hypothetical protein [Sulfuricurvum sp.]MDD4885140.1 hypothetical protein [Sulfuricurvum sp.]
MKAILLMALVATMAAADYSVVISKKTAFSALSMQQIRDIYLQKRHSVGDKNAIAVNILGHDEVREIFETKVLGMDRNRLNTYWIKQHFQGVTPPLTQPSFESVKTFIVNVEGAIGYLPSDMVDSQLKVVYEF